MREENLLLAALPNEERERLSPYLKEVVLDFQQVLIEPNEQITDLYFPFDAITSTVQEMNDGDSVETGLQQAGLISYSRGQMRILDQEGLRNGSCDCLEIIEKQFEQVFK